MDRQVSTDTCFDLLSCLDSVYIAIISFNGWGVTLIDALDTMWIMDLREEFYRTLPLIANLTFSSPEKVRPFLVLPLLIICNEY